MGLHPPIMLEPGKIFPMETAITRMLGLRYPIVAAPMFLVSNAPLLQAVAEAGAIGVIPSLNFRTHQAFREFLEAFPEGLKFGVNLILKDNPRLEEDLQAVVERKVPLVVTSLGDPTRVVEAVKGYGGVVWCDVVGLRHGRKAVEAGADALVAVACGAGGHAGPVSPFVLGPWLRGELGVPVLIAGGIATGAQVLAALALGDGVYIGTRFIATLESAAPLEYKEALLRAHARGHRLHPGGDRGARQLPPGLPGALPPGWGQGLEGGVLRRARGGLHPGDPLGQGGGGPAGGGVRKRPKRPGCPDGRHVVKTLRLLAFLILGLAPGLGPVRPGGLRRPPPKG
jgi:nitronate monooxygenase